MSLTNEITAARTAETWPPCPECAVALHPAGAGRHRYWSCRHCGITMRRS